jgi:hypothetical protein
MVLNFKSWKQNNGVLISFWATSHIWSWHSISWSVENYVFSWCTCTLGTREFDALAACGVVVSSPLANKVHSCHNPSLRLATKAKACKVTGQEGARESPHMLVGVQRVRGNEPSHSQVNSHYGSWSPNWIFEFLKHNFRGQNPSVGRIFYIIKKLLRHKCLKWARMIHLDI